MAAGRRDSSHKSLTRAAPVTRAIALAVVLLTGCGSKISEANYYRVQNGMTEDAVDELLGPPHRQGVETEPATEAVARSPTTSPADAPTPQRTVKTWTRDALVISVVFQDGKVVGRRVIGGEGGAR